MLVRRWIQTPSAAKVRSAVQREGEVVLGASPPARRAKRGGSVGLKTAARANRTASSVVAASGDDATRGAKRGGSVG